MAARSRDHRRGIGKGLASWGAPPIPGLASLREADPQGIADWAKEVDPAHPDVENAGRYVTPTNVMLGRLPDLGMLAAKATAPWAVRAGSKLAQNAWKSTVGGAAEANLDTPSGDEAGRRVARGAAEGLGTGLAVTGGQAALRAMPYWVIPALLAGGEMARGGHFMPYHVRHLIAAGLASLAARAAHVPAGLVGAGGEAAAQQTGNEPGGSKTERPEPF